MSAVSNAKPPANYEDEFISIRGVCGAEWLQWVTAVNHVPVESQWTERGWSMVQTAKGMSGQGKKNKLSRVGRVGAAGAAHCGSPRAMFTLCLMRGEVVNLGNKE